MTVSPPLYPFLCPCVERFFDTFVDTPSPILIKTTVYICNVYYVNTFVKNPVVKFRTRENRHLKKYCKINEALEDVQYISHWKEEQMLNLMLF